MQLPVRNILMRIAFVQQSLVAVRNEIMQACIEMPIDGTNVIALEQILVMCETTLASLDRTHVRLTAWKQIYPNHVSSANSYGLALDADDDIDDDVLNLSDDMLDLDDDDDNDDDGLDLNDDDLYRDPEDKQCEYTQDECDGYLLPLSFAQDNLPMTDNSLTDYEFALLFGLVQPSQDQVTLTSPIMYNIFGDLLPMPPNLPIPPHTAAPSDTYPDPDPDYNVPGSI